MGTIRSIQLKTWELGLGSRPVLALKLGLLAVGLVLILFGTHEGIAFACNDGGSCE